MLYLDWTKLKLVLSRPVTDAQVVGFNSLISELNNAEASLYEATYIVATALFSTNNKLTPTIEDEFPDFYTDMYDIEGTRKTTALRLGNTEKGDGEKYKQRGFVPLLGKNNYKAFEDFLDIPLVTSPELLEEVETASKVLVEGMLQGLFTGLYLSKYINSRNKDYINARRVVDGVESAKKIAILAQQLESAIKTT